MFTTPSITAEGATIAATRKRKKASGANEGDDDYPTYDDASLLKKPKMFDACDKLDQSPADILKKSPERKSKTNENNEEKRQRRFRQKAPQSYLAVKERALSQRLTVLSRERIGTEEVPEEKVVMAGSTGNVYTQRITHVPTCDCPHARKGNQCKHIIYVMLRVLKVPENIGYQLALVSSELRDIFKNAPPIPNAASGSADDADGETDHNRKKIEGECPICYTDFEPKSDDIVYCKASCGNNVHKECMRAWNAAKAGKATCPYCRAPWENDAGFGGKVDLANVKETSEGYLNVAGDLGISRVRDYSTYHQPWVNGYRGRGSNRHLYTRRY